MSSDAVQFITDLLLLPLLLLFHLLQEGEGEVGEETAAIFQTIDGGAGGSSSFIAVMVVYRAVSLFLSARGGGEGKGIFDLFADLLSSFRAQIGATVPSFVSFRPDSPR